MLSPPASLPTWTYTQADADPLLWGQPSGGLLLGGGWASQHSNALQSLRWYLSMKYFLGASSVKGIKEEHHCALPPRRISSNQGDNIQKGAWRKTQPNSDLWVWTMTAESCFISCLVHLRELWPLPGDSTMWEWGFIWWTLFFHELNRYVCAFALIGWSPILREANSGAFLPRVYGCVQVAEVWSQPFSKE